MGNCPLLASIISQISIGNSIMNFVTFSLQKKQGCFEPHQKLINVMKAVVLVECNISANFVAEPC
jgi:hypothetical protein